MMRSRTLAMFAVVSTLLVPGAARADGTCTVLTDPAGDVYGVENAFGLGSLAGMQGPQDPSADILRVGMIVEGSDVVAWIHVADLKAIDGSGELAHYTVGWYIDSSSFSLTAEHGAKGWRFMKSVGRSDEYVSGETPGSVDAEAGVIELRMPLPDVGAPLGTELQNVNAYASHHKNVGAEGVFSFGAPGPSDYVDGGGFILSTECPAPLTDAGERCLVLEDAEGDVYRDALFAPNPTGSVDIKSVQIATNPGTLVLELHVGDLSEDLPEGTERQYWAIAWRDDDAEYSVYAQRDRSQTYFNAYGPEGYTRVVGTFDAAADVVRFLMPRGDEFLDGARLRDVRASTNEAGPTIFAVGDYAPDDYRSASYIVGVSCADQLLQACPVVIDQAGDAGPIIDLDGTQIPENQPALDLLASGAEASRDTVTLSAKVAGLDAGPPSGFDGVGWTVSWRKGEGERWIAQAQRVGDEVTFSYAVDPGEYGPSGPVFGGTVATGTLDPESNVVTVNVPRDAVGSTADGSTLAAFGASAWAVRTGNTAAPYQVVDSTSLGEYRIGLSCGA